MNSYRIIATVLILLALAIPISAEQVTLVANSTNVKGHSGRLTGTENTYAASYNMSQCCSTVTVPSGAQLTAMSSDDNTFFNQTGTSSLDATTIINFTLSNVQSVNWVNIIYKGSSTEGAEHVIVGLKYVQNNTVQRLVWANPAQNVQVQLSYNVSSAADKANFLNLSGNTLQFNMSRWNNGTGNVGLSSNLFMAVVDYEPAPPNSPPNVTNISSSNNVTSGSNLIITPNGTDIDNDTLTWSTNATSSGESSFQNNTFEIDASVSQANPTTNYPSDCVTDTGGCIESNYVAGSEIAIIAKANSSGIPAGATINSVTLYMYNKYGSADTMTAYNVTGSWTETEVTWNTRPNRNNSIGSRTNNGIGWQPIDITNAGRNWYNGSWANNGFYINQTIDDGSVFSSREGASNKPYISWNYTTADGDPRVVFNTTTGIFNFTSNGSDIGNNNWYIQADDGHGGTNRTNFTITVSNETAANNYSKNISQNVNVGASVVVSKVVAAIKYAKNVSQAVAVQTKVTVSKTVASVKHFGNISQQFIVTQAINISKWAAPIMRKTNVSQIVSMIGSVSAVKTVAPVNRRINVSQGIIVGNTVSVRKITASVKYNRNVSQVLSVQNSVTISKYTASVAYKRNVSQGLSVGNSVSVSKSTASVKYGRNVSQQISVVQGVNVSKTAASVKYNRNVSQSISVGSNVSVSKTLAPLNIYINSPQRVQIGLGVMTYKSVAPIHYFQNVFQSVSIMQGVSTSKVTAPIIKSVNIGQSIDIGASVAVSKIRSTLNYTKDVSQTATIGHAIKISKNVSPLAYNRTVDQAFTVNTTVSVSKNVASVKYYSSISQPLSIIGDILISKYTAPVNKTVKVSQNVSIVNTATATKIPYHDTGEGTNWDWAFGWVKYVNGTNVNGATVFTSQGNAYTDSNGYYVFYYTFEHGQTYWFNITKNGLWNNQSITFSSGDYEVVNATLGSAVLRSVSVSQIVHVKDSIGKSNSGNFTVDGYVTNRKNESVYNALVKLGAQQMYTGVDGYYNFTVNEGIYLQNVSGYPYLKKLFSVTVDGHNVRNNVSLWVAEMPIQAEDTPGFESIFALLGIVTIYIIIRRK